jgi:hypothetical protein
MGRAGSRRPVSADAQVESQNSPCGICGGRSGNGTGYSPQYFDFPLSVSFHQCSILIHWCISGNDRPIVIKNTLKVTQCMQLNPAWGPDCISRHFKVVLITTRVLFQIRQSQRQEHGSHYQLLAAQGLSILLINMHCPPCHHLPCTRIHKIVTRFSLR